MGMAGFIIGTVAGQFSGAWVYWQVRGNPAGAVARWIDEAMAAGLVTTIVASAIYIPLGVHTWLGGDGASWGESVFLGLCMGICQGLLFRGRPLRPPTRRP
jgi:hypothetical protein